MIRKRNKDLKVFIFLNIF